MEKKSRARKQPQQQQQPLDALLMPPTNFIVHQMPAVPHANQQPAQPALYAQQQLPPQQRAMTGRKRAHDDISGAVDPQGQKVGFFLNKQISLNFLN